MKVLSIRLKDRPLWTFLLLSLLLHTVLLRLSLPPSVAPPAPVLEVRIEASIHRLQPPAPVPTPAPRVKPNPTQAQPAPRQPESLASSPVKPVPQTESAPILPVPAPAVSPPTPAPRAEKPNAEGKSGIIFDAAYLRNPPPEYPPQSRALEEEGVVKLKVRVSAEGRARTVEMAKSSGFKRLDTAALEAVRQWRFVPAKQDGQAIEDTVIVPLRFTLNE